MATPRPTESASSETDRHIVMTATPETRPQRYPTRAVGTPGPGVRTRSGSAPRARCLCCSGLRRDANPFLSPPGRAALRLMKGSSSTGWLPGAPSHLLLVRSSPSGTPR